MSVKFNLTKKRKLTTPTPDFSAEESSTAAGDTRSGHSQAEMEGDVSRLQVCRAAVLCFHKGGAAARAEGTLAFSSKQAIVWLKVHSSLKPFKDGTKH